MISVKQALAQTMDFIRKEVEEVPKFDRLAFLEHLDIDIDDLYLEIEQEQSHAQHSN